MFFMPQSSTLGLIGLEAFTPQNKEKYEKLTNAFSEWVEGNFNPSQGMEVENVVMDLFGISIRLTTNESDRNFTQTVIPDRLKYRPTEDTQKMISQLNNAVLSRLITGHAGDLIYTGKTGNSAIDFERIRVTGVLSTIINYVSVGTGAPRSNEDEMARVYESWLMELGKILDTYTISLHVTETFNRLKQINIDNKDSFVQRRDKIVQEMKGNSLFKDVDLTDISQTLDARSFSVELIGVLTRVIDDTKRDSSESSLPGTDFIALLGMESHINTDANPAKKKVTVWSALVGVLKIILGLCMIYIGYVNSVNVGTITILIAMNGAPLWIILIGAVLTLLFTVMTIRGVSLVWNTLFGKGQSKETMRELQPKTSSKAAARAGQQDLQLANDLVALTTLSSDTKLQTISMTKKGRERVDGIRQWFKTLTVAPQPQGG